MHLDVDFLCDIAMDGAEAIEVILNDILLLHNGERSSYALILMDCQMPVMDGFECAREIRRYLNKYKLPQPIITAVTGHLSQGSFDLAKRSGMNQVLSKPISPELLEDLCFKLNIK